MSIHAHSTPEAKATLRHQHRVSAIASLIIGILLLIVLAGLLWVVIIRSFTIKVETIVSYAPEKVEEEQVTRPVVRNDVKRAPAPPSSASPPFDVVRKPSDFSIPIPKVMADMDTPDFGTVDGFGDGFGEGAGIGLGGRGPNSFTALPPSMQKRCSQEDRLARVEESGGTLACEAAVVKSLDWMQRTQNDNGSWCSRYPVAMTGLSVLSYLGHCETPMSVKYGETVEKGIVYLIGIAIKNKGRMATDFSGHPYVYEHAIATYALAEAYTFCQIISYEIEGLEQAVLMAANFILRGQNAAGMWDYEFKPGKRRDLSISAWCLQALKAVQATKLNVSGIGAAARKALEGIRKNQAANGAIGYRNTSPSKGKYKLTGAGVLCFQQWGKKNDRLVKKAIQWMDVNTDFTWGTESAELYGHYYNSQALIEHGGKVWKAYNLRIRDEVIKGQAADGSFTRPGGTGGTALYNGGDKTSLHYRTCLATLMLEVYYRFLPGTGAKQ